MSQRRLFRGPRCDVANCKSTRYYRADGLTYCHNNHQATGVLEYQIDDDEAQASGFGSRRKRGPELQGLSTKKVSRTYRGKLGYAAFLQAYQLVMRLQAKFICEKLAVNSFEALYRDLWRAFLETQDTAAKLPDSDETESAETASRGESDPDSVLTAESGSESPANLLPSDSEYESNGPEISSMESYSDTKYRMHRPLLIHTIALSYLALLLLRVPITINDFRSWIDAEEYPYIRAIRHLPETLVARLEPQYYEALDPQVRPRPSRMWKWTQQTARYLTIHTGLQFPSLNHRPLLFTMIKNMLLPVEIYNIVEVQLTALGISTSIVFDQKVRMNGVPPEIRILCVLLVSSKLVYNLDETKRGPVDASLPVYRRPNLAAWRHVTKLLIAGFQGVDVTSKVQPRDVLAMDGKTTDEYLDWFGRTWGSSTSESMVRPGFVPEGILQMFPTEEPVRKEQEEDLNPEAERLETVRWLYSQPYDAGDMYGLPPGSGYVATTPEKPLVPSIFDDLVELASLQHGIANKELRRFIILLERRIANQHIPRTKVRGPTGQDTHNHPDQTGNGRGSSAAGVVQPYTTNSRERTGHRSRTSDEDSDFDFVLDEEEVDSDP